MDAIKLLNLTPESAQSGHGVVVVSVVRNSTGWPSLILTASSPIATWSPCRCGRSRCANIRWTRAQRAEWVAVLGLERHQTGGPELYVAVVAQAKNAEMSLETA